jgi:formylglycine-generating enzyme required for sulfatase activity
MLPTEQQWQHAAQGDDGRLYPWGNVWAAERCNNGIGKNWQTCGTTPVKHYEGKGDSPFGVVDMGGNVWEWCLTRYDTNETKLEGRNMRVTRGGSWFFTHPNDVRTMHRNYWESGTRLFVIGFRCALV